MTVSAPGDVIESSTGGTKRHYRISDNSSLALCGVCSWLCYVAIAFSSRSLHESNSHDHGLIILLVLFGLAFGLYITALRIAMGMSPSQWLLPMLWIGAIAFRLTLLLSDPIEEIDLYRYVWDGAVSKAGVNPFRYAPHQVIGSSSTDTLPDDLARLVRLRDASPELTAILRRVHFGELPTIYPPVSQVVFAACSWLTPNDSSVTVRMTLMKAWFVGFDLITLSLVIWILRLTHRNLGWAFAYGWCPLIVKEIANSGHLDSLAITLTTLALAWTLLALRSRGDTSSSRRFTIGVAVALALGVGAKLYPIVLAPLLFWTIAKRLDWTTGLLWCAVFGGVTVVVMWPMKPTRAVQQINSAQESAIELPADDLPPLPPSEASTTIRDPSESLQAFLSRWEMNDFLFLLVVENLRPTDDLPADQIAWFTVTPSWWRTALAAKAESYCGLPATRSPFILTRALLSLAFVLLACLLAVWAGPKASETTMSDTSSSVLEAAFLTLAWFWLLLPTQNPWYLIWCLPFIPFARSRAWLALSGLAFIYYLRFWMTAQFPFPLFGTPYSGPQFFDYIVTWIEFAPWLLVLACGWIVRQQLSPNLTSLSDGTESHRKKS